MKYKWIEENKMHYSVELMCRVLGVSQSGYYDSIERPLSDRAIRRREMTKAIQFSHERSFQIYGYRKVYEDLVQEMKIECCKETVRRIMRANGLRSKVNRTMIIR